MNFFGQMLVLIYMGFIMECIKIISNNLQNIYIRNMVQVWNAQKYHLHNTKLCLAHLNTLKNSHSGQYLIIVNTSGSGTG